MWKFFCALCTCFLLLFAVAFKWTFWIIATVTRLATSTLAISYRLLGRYIIKKWVICCFAWIATLAHQTTIWLTSPLPLVKNFSIHKITRAPRFVQNWFFISAVFFSSMILSGINNWRLRCYQTGKRLKLAYAIHMHHKCLSISANDFSESSHSQIIHLHNFVTPFKLIKSLQRFICCLNWIIVQPFELNWLRFVVL